MTVVPEFTGPWVTTAVFCEKVIEDKEGVLTLVRVIDRLIISASGVETLVPEKLPPAQVQIIFVITIKAGTAKGRSEVVTEIEGPDGINRAISSQSVNFPAPNYGQNLVNNIALGVQHEGVYWFTVKADGRVLTRSPLEILYARSATSMPSPAGFSPPGAL